MPSTTTIGSDSFASLVAAARGAATTAHRQPPTAQCAAARMTKSVVHATASIMHTPLATSTITSAATGPATEPSSENVGRAANVSPVAVASQPVTPTAVRG